MTTVISMVENYNIFFILGLICVQIILLFLIWFNFLETRRLKGRIRRLTETGEGHDLTAVLERFHDLSAIKMDIERLQERVADLQVGYEQCYSRLGLVRFSAFPDTGSDLSFALALLTREGNGFILTSIYARDENRVYVKPVVAGRATTYRLSEEEEKAMGIALGIYNNE